MARKIEGCEEMKSDLKKAVLKKESQKISREMIFDCPEAYVYSSVSLTGIPDDVKEEVHKKHEQFWKEILQVIEAHTGLVQASKLTDDPIHKCQ